MTNSSQQSAAIGDRFDYRAHRYAVMRATTESGWARFALIGSSCAFMALFLLVPLVCVFFLAFAEGFVGFCKALTTKATGNAIRMTLIATFIAVPLNIVFGMIASWCIGKFQFLGKGILISLIDIPFAISPLIVGLLFVFLFGSCFVAFVNEIVEQPEFGTYVFGYFGFVVFIIFIIGERKRELCAFHLEYGVGSV